MGSRWTMRNDDVSLATQKFLGSVNMTIRY